MQVCISLQTDNHASTPSLSFYWPDAFLAAQSKAIAVVFVLVNVATATVVIIK